MLVLLPGLFASLAAAENDPRQLEFFERKIRPVLVKHCYKCHGSDPKAIKGGLRLDSREGLRKGGETGPAIVTGKPAESLLIQALKYQDVEMPPAGKLPKRIIRDFETWIRLGAVDPRSTAPAPTTKMKTPPSGIDFGKARQFWSFRPPLRHPAPKVRSSAWPRRKIDFFALAKMESQGLSPNSAADRRTLIRRVYFDLIGLPPSPEVVDAFVRDRSRDAFPKVVERLLSLPQFGERWARLWLDVARYAEDQAHIVGNNKSLFYPNAYRYRDWVIRAFNDDLPYNEFIRRQLAADKLLPNEPAQHVALGFLGLGPKYYRRNAPEVMADEWEDRVDLVGRGLLGLTVACARCHDHKYDPIPATDYYALAGVFASTDMWNRPLPGKKASKNGQAKDPADAIHIVRDGSPKDLNVMIRGDVKKKGELVKRRYLTILSAQPRPFSKGSGRAELAQSIATEDNPLAARVIVNRIWAAYFGRGLVDTPSNFGQLGQRPSHPRLLDDLARRFMDAGWSLKWLHREIIFSATYQQSSELKPEKVAQDGANLWLSRMSRRRLSVEAWRDAVLSAAGRLSPEVGGPSMDPSNPSETRRTLYSRISRMELDQMLALFDFPDPNAHNAKRSETTTPLQKLFVLNSDFMHKNAVRLAERAKSAESDTVSRIRFLYKLLFGRAATSQEEALGRAYLDDATAARDRWTDYAQVLIAANEMLIID